ncbi:hypothetical protein [uncultured Amnibacterium sp.]|uniref:hypothetical protein n=1 Tax=uncultured Amnibacterium sp. TaxID=1631851 RepID=UPI0035CBEECF
MDALVFGTRDGTAASTNNVRWQLRHVLDLAGIEGVTPRAFRRTVATAINEQAGVDLAAELLDEAFGPNRLLRRDSDDLAK